MRVTGTHHQQVSEVSWEVHSRDKRKERLLTFKEEDNGGRAKVTTSDERVL